MTGMKKQVIITLFSLAILLIASSVLAATYTINGNDALYVTGKGWTYASAVNITNGGVGASCSVSSADFSCSGVDSGTTPTLTPVYNPSLPTGKAAALFPRTLGSMTANQSGVVLPGVALSISPASPVVGGDVTVTWNTPPGGVCTDLSSGGTIRSVPPLYWEKDSFVDVERPLDSGSVTFETNSDPGSYNLTLSCLGPGSRPSNPITYGTVTLPVTILEVEPTYTVSTSVSPTGAGSVSGGGSYTQGEIALLTATPASGYVFQNWSGDASGSANPLTVTIDSDQTIVAVFEASGTGDPGGDPASNPEELFCGPTSSLTSIFNSPSAWFVPIDSSDSRPAPLNVTGKAQSKAGALHFGQVDCPSPLFLQVVYPLQVWGDAFISGLLQTNRIEAAFGTFENPITVNEQTIGASSDRRLKTNINPLPSTLSKILQLRPVSFQFKDPTTYGSGTKLGLIAQEVEPVFPEVVSSDGDNYSVDYAAIVVPLIKSVQERQAQINDLKQELADLQTAR